MGPDRRYDSFGLCFGPNRRFSTHFGPNFMFSAPTGTLASQDLGFGQPGFGQPGFGQAPLLLLADPDHEIQDFDQFLLEKLVFFWQSPSNLQLYEEFLKVTSIVTAFLQGL